MVKVAVAGGTGEVGLHIVEGILETKKHTVVVLSRSSSYPALESLGAQIAAVSYDDPASLVAALDGVHTVVSALPVYEAAPQLALLEASVKAGVKRFAPSEWAMRSVPDNRVELYRTKWVVAEAVRRSGLEYTIFENGLFMNYLAASTPGIGHLRDLRFIWNVEKGTAEIPGDGSAHIVLTRVEDVGRFVAASLDWERWPEYSQMRGDRKTLNEVLKAAEVVRGQSFDAKYIPKEALEKTIADESTPIFAKFGAQLYLDMLEENPIGYTGTNVNDAFPEVQPVKLEEFLKQWWTKA